MDPDFKYRDPRKRIIMKIHRNDIEVSPWDYDNYLQDSQNRIDQNIADHFIPQLYGYNIDDY